MFVLRVGPGFAASVMCASLCLSVPAEGAGGQKLLPGDAPELQIRLFNLAGVPEGSLIRAEAEAGRVLKQAAIGVRWVAGDSQDRLSLRLDFSRNQFSGGGCNEPLPGQEVLVQLLPRSPRGISPEKLGFSVPCARFGIQSTIFVDHCRLSAQRTVDLSTVLAYAIVHELGHVLMRSSEHTPSGLMRARWNARDWVAAASGRIGISSEEADRVRAELLKRTPVFVADASR